MKERFWARLEPFLSDRKKSMNVLLLVGVLGMLLLAISEWVPSEPKKADEISEPVTQAEYAEQLETKLTAILKRLNGVGKVQVAVTLASGEETVYAKNRQYSNGSLQREEHLLVNGSRAYALVETTDAPQVQGVAVVCEGGDSVSVQNDILQIVSVLTGVGASHISVTKMAMG